MVCSVPVLKAKLYALMLKNIEDPSPAQIRKLSGILRLSEKLGILIKSWYDTCRTTKVNF